MVREIKALWIVPQKIAKHVDHQNHRADEIQCSSNDGVPIALGETLIRSQRRDIDIHRDRNTNKLDESAGFH